MNSNQLKIGLNFYIKHNIHLPNKIINHFIKQLKYYFHFLMKQNHKEIELKKKEQILKIK